MSKQKTALVLGVVGFITGYLENQHKLVYFLKKSDCTK